MIECDKSVNPCEFAFIPCLIRKGANICRHNENTLNAYIPGTRTLNMLLDEHSDIFKPFQIGDVEGILLFTESDMEKAADIMKAKVKGKNMSAKPKRHINISEERKKELSNRMKSRHSYAQIIGGNTRKTG